MVRKYIISHQSQRFRFVVTENPAQVALVDANTDEKICKGMAQVLQSQFCASKAFAYLIPFAGNAGESIAVTRVEQPRYVIAAVA